MPWQPAAFLAPAVLVWAYLSVPSSRHDIWHYHVTIFLWFSGAHPGAHPGSKVVTFLILLLSVYVTIQLLQVPGSVSEIGPALGALRCNQVFSGSALGRRRSRGNVTLILGHWADLGRSSRFWMTLVDLI